MAHVVTINRPDVVAMIEEAAGRLTSGNKTAAVALALRQLLDRESRTGTLFGAHKGSVEIIDDYDLTLPTFDVVWPPQAGGSGRPRRPPTRPGPIARGY